MADDAARRAAARRNKRPIHDSPPVRGRCDAPVCMHENCSRNFRHGAALPSIALITGAHVRPVRFGAVGTGRVNAGGKLCIGWEGTPTPQTPPSCTGWNTTFPLAGRWLALWALARPSSKEVTGSAARQNLRRKQHCNQIGGEPAERPLRARTWPQKTRLLKRLRLYHFTRLRSGPTT
jgi:hypothetical protein